VSRCVEPLTDDVSVVQLAQRGDSAAFGRLYSTYARLVHGILISRVPAADVEDLLQDVFMQAMEKLHTLRDPGAFGGWIAAIARHRAVDHLRRRPHTTDLPDNLAAAESGNAQAFELLAVIRTLPDAYRETLALRLVEGLTGPEIAACTGLTPASVRVNLHRGMKQLRERLGILERNVTGA
jgi:RNA polymerase sigma-70 factor, ECF subfamily